MTAVLIAVSAAVLGLLATVLLVPALVLLAQSLAALRRMAPDASPEGGGRPRVGVLMPAHDEAAGIAVAIASVRGQLGPGDRLLVVADNCTDATAAVAAAAGAEVTERHDLLRRGKGYALDHGVRHYAAAPVDVVVIVDADCELGPGALARLARLAADSGRPVQALYLMRAAEGARVGARVSEFAWRVRNHWRPLGCRALGWPCQLMGTGMAFPWALIASASLASGHLVEDMELGLALAASGTPPLFCPEARVESRFARDEAAGRTQRTRWEHGHLAMIAGRALPMLVRGLTGGRPGLAAMALDLCVPPLAGFVMLQSAAAVASAAFWAAADLAAPLRLALAGLGATTVAVAVAWRNVGRDLIAPSELLSIPVYACRKVPIYLTWFTARQKQWIRTRRDDTTKR